MICFADSSQMLLADFFRRVYVPRRLPGRNPNTLRLYAHLLYFFSRFLGRDAKVADLDEPTALEFLDWYGSTRAPRSRNRVRDQLLALAGLAQRQGLLRIVPDLPKMPEPRRAPQSLTPDQVARLLAACAGLHGEICAVPAALFWRTLFLVGLSTGLRASALFALRRADIDFADRSLLARAETQKQNADQRLRLTPAALAAIAAIWEPDRELLFPWDRHPTTRYHYLRRLCVAAGLPDDRRHKLHALRRTCATWTHRYGGDATAQLGHADNATTRRHYLDPSAYRQAADVVPWDELLPPDDPQRRLF